MLLEFVKECKAVGGDVDVMYNLGIQQISGRGAGRNLQPRANLPKFPNNKWLLLI
jgi:hypothetical protein